MILIKQAALIVVFLISCTLTKGQEFGCYKISSVKFFKESDGRGYTTAGAFTHFDEMKKDSVNYLFMDSLGIEKLKVVLGNAVKRKQMQTKHGVGLIFFEIELRGPHASQHRFIMSGYKPTGSPAALTDAKKPTLTDLTLMQRYEITNEEDVNWLVNYLNQLRLND